MRAYDSDSTRRRLLEAATADFAAHGIAGARVDRIAAAAGVNKAQLYTYYGDKLGLFEAVYRANADLVVDATPFTAEDLAGYAVNLYDAALARPEVVRLAAWARLERVPTEDPSTGTPANLPKLLAIAEAQRAGFLVDDVDPRNVLAMVIAMAIAWSDAGLSGTAAADAPPTDREDQRRALHAAVSRAFHRTRSVHNGPEQGSPDAI
jgi:AcrR family transcriptional regulator